MSLSSGQGAVPLSLLSPFSMLSNPATHRCLLHICDHLIRSVSVYFSLCKQLLDASLYGDLEHVKSALAVFK
jgi:hypothetical protein